MTERDGLRRFAIGCWLASLSACAGQPPVPVTPCTGYCQTYEEGYQWARNGNLADERACDGYAEAFRQGCEQGVADLYRLRPSREGL